MWGTMLLGGAAIITFWWAVALSLVDERERRLPDALTLPAAAGTALGAVLTEPWLLAGGACWAGLYLVTGLFGGGIGGGDIKLALSLGILAAAAGGPTAWFIAVVGASAVTITRGVATRARDIAHGPSMIGATAGAMLLV